MAEREKTERGWRAFGAAILAAVVLLGPGTARAGSDCAGPPIGAGRVAGVDLPGGTGRPVLRLSGDVAVPGAVLAGVLLPAAAGAEVRTALAAAVAARSGAVVTVHAARLRTDRRGRIGGVVLLPDGTSLQADLVAAGLVLVDADGTPCTAALLDLERTARAGKRGLWRSPGAVLPATGFDPALLPDHVVLAGRVATVGRRGSTTYLNFGGRFSEDATVRIGDPVAAALAAAGRPPGNLAGRDVLVRGFAVAENGLDIRLASPEALSADGNGTER